MAPPTRGQHYCERMPTELTCPKCLGTMRQYERNGVVVEQCLECRGLFLDRGELEQLIAAETRWNTARYGAAHDTDADFDPERRLTRRSFLGDLFD